MAIAEGAEVRLRKADEQRLLTVKRGQGEVRHEVEVEVASDQFDALWPLTAVQRLRKRRYRVPLEDGLEAEVDVSEGELGGLVTVEVEFDGEARSRAFHPPPWFGREVTGDSRYANQALAVDGLRMLSSLENGDE